MLAHLDATRGPIFADGAGARAPPRLGREAAHELVEHAAKQVRDTGAHLRDVLADDPTLAGPETGALLDAAFDLTPSVAAAAAWTDRALLAADQIRSRVFSSNG